ncbi:Arc family DNA-binding protein [Aeromonas caviae]|uniref:Arc family DNA-binding protein n=1 Tax=Aeromonas caviae TaxID=648 RepID=UPI0029D9C58F|nr:Arc family DNA-binding protein [Aeromonas caviae]MDX7753336.1 Arc family DNA-binding protein [Aeromonas caviae]
MMSKKSTVPTSRESDKFVLRMPDGMRGEIAEWAKASGRSMNAEIVYRLRRTFDEDAERAESGVKIIEGLHIDQGARMLPPGTILTPREFSSHDPRYNPDAISDQLKDVSAFLESIAKEIKNKRG